LPAACWLGMLSSLDSTACYLNHSPLLPWLPLAAVA
jgi:hypothetical protein